mmetsp:Transcript_18831/g.57223  ORF Transcript_18831/g.57223 Transcript_18831/m.57223 type:complete len:263 (-) Transcript_18831:296-1084(-)
MVSALARLRTSPSSATPVLSGTGSSGAAPAPCSCARRTTPRGDSAPALTAASAGSPSGTIASRARTAGAPRRAAAPCGRWLPRGWRPRSCFGRPSRSRTGSAPSGAPSGRGRWCPGAPRWPGGARARSPPPSTPSCASSTPRGPSPCSCSRAGGRASPAGMSPASRCRRRPRPARSRRRTGTGTPRRAAATPPPAASGRRLRGHRVYHYPHCLPQRLRGPHSAAERLRSLRSSCGRLSRSIRCHWRSRGSCHCHRWRRHRRG